MTRIKLYVTGAKAHAEVSGELTSGMVGIPVEIYCDDTWSELKKNLVCRNGDVTRTILDVKDAAVVAHETMIAGQKLELGIEGRNADGTLVIPSVWADCGFVVEGVSMDKDPGADPFLSVWAQLQNRINALENQEIAMPSIFDIGALPAPASAQVGQYFRVSAVDESGMVTAVEAVDAPTGGGASDEQVAASIEAWLDAHPEATTTVADGSVSEKKTTFFSESFVELFGELGVGFGDNTLAGYHKKTIPVEPGKTYIVNYAGWINFFDENKTEITEGYALTRTAGDGWSSNYTLTIPEDSALRYIRTTIIDSKMTDSLPSCYEGSVNIGEITRGSKLVTFDYADSEKAQNAFGVYSGENLIDGSGCTVNSGEWYTSNLVPVKMGEKYYQSSNVGQLSLYNHCGKLMPHTWTYPDDWKPDTGTPVTGSCSGVYTIPEGAYFAASLTTLTDGEPDCWLVKSPKIITAGQLGKPFIDSDIAREFVKEYFDGQHLVGLKLACLGDSVTNMSQYGSTVAGKHNMTYIHGGTDGARYTATTDYAENIAYYKVANLDAETDVVVLMFGTNDISNTLDIGEFTDNTLYTLYGALRKTFDLLTTKFTGKRIGVVTSPQRNFNTCAYDKWKEYNDIIKKMAMLYKIPVLDGEYAGLVYGLANDYSHFTDDVHPATAGSAALADNIGKFIESLPIYHRDGE